mmetsp:Transcript_15452/g.44254  ORF Transcript_15452/g.44254 Transcript_15452/m.44254 type:complete len:267 (-) Transcript_15452:127-927(-)
MMLLLVPAILLGLAASLGEPEQSDATSFALSADDSCLSAACALSALQTGASRAAAPQATQAGQLMTNGRAVCTDREGDHDSCIVRLLVGKEDGEVRTVGTSAGVAVLVQVLAGDQPIPTTDGLYPHTGCLEVFDSGAQSPHPRFRLQVSPCQVGASNQQFQADPSTFRILWDTGNGDKLCLTSFRVGTTTIVGFGVCNSDTESINNFNQTFQFVGKSMAAICQCRCVSLAICPIPCAFNAACLHTRHDGPVQNIVLENPEQFWNRR